MAEKGSFDSLNSAADGYISGLGLKKAEIEAAEAADAAEVEQELIEKEAVIAKIVSAKALEAEVKPVGKSRGKRNADALFSYIKSMGGVSFAVFCGFTVGNIGFRSAQRKFSASHSS